MGNRLAQSNYDYLRQRGGERGIMEILVTESFFFYPYFSLHLYFLSTDELAPNLLLIEVRCCWLNYCAIVCMIPLLVSSILHWYQRIQKLFCWKGLKNSITSFVKQCQVCQQAKHENCKYLGLLSPLPIPSCSWQDVSMDFIEGLPLSNGYSVILVVVDRFTKYGHFFPRKHPYTAHSVAAVFLDNVVKLHGLPKSITSDRDKVFTSAF
jgi:hypothetical protein